MTEIDPQTTPNEPPQIDVIDAETAAPPAKPSETVGTGSYIAVSCTAVMLLLTAVLIGVVFLLRWIG